MHKILLSILFLSILVTYPASAIIYQGFITAESLYIDQELKNQILLEMEIGHIIDYNKLLYVRQSLALHHEDEETIVEHKILESFMDLYLEQVFMRMGKQITDWGSSHGVNITERLSPLDLTSRDRTAKGEGIESLSFDYYYSPSTTITGIIAWEFSPHILSQKMVEKRVEKLVGEMEDRQLDLIIERPNLTGLKGNQYALRWAREILFGRADLSLSYVWSYEQYPMTTQRESERIKEELLELKEGESLSPITLIYKRARGPGLHLASPLLGSLLYLEAQYMENEEKEKAIEIALGIEHTSPNGAHTLLQYYHREEEGQEMREGASILTLHLKRPFFNRSSLQLGAKLHLTEKAININPELALGLGQRAILHLGASIERGEREERKENGNEVVYLNINYSF